MFNIVDHNTVVRIINSIHEVNKGNEVKDIPIDNLYKKIGTVREEIIKEIEEQENIINGTKPNQLLIDEFK